MSNTCSVVENNYFRAMGENGGSSYPDWGDVDATIQHYLLIALKAIEADLERQSPSLGESPFEGKSRDECVEALASAVPDYFGKNFIREVKAAS